MPLKPLTLELMKRKRIPVYKIIKRLKEATPRNTLAQFYRLYYKKAPPKHADVQYLWVKIGYAYQYLKHKKDGRLSSLRPGTVARFRKIIKQELKSYDKNLLEGGFIMGGLKKKKGKGTEAKAPAKAKVKKPSIASIVYEMIEAGGTNKKIIATVKKKFPESKINENHMSWYRNQLDKKKGIVKTPKKKKAAPEKKEKKSEVKKSKKKKKAPVEDEEEEEEDEELDEEELDEDEEEEEEEEEDEEEDDEDEDDEDEDEEDEEEDE